MLHSIGPLQHNRRCHVRQNKGDIKKILFLCTQNACRSQMAEAVVGHEPTLLDVRTFSAGTSPAEVHPLAVRVLAEEGIDISKNRSKHIDEFDGQQFDLVVTLCGGTAEACPFRPGQGKHIHVGFYDPAQASGTEEERLEAFRRVRDDIRARLIPIVKKELEL